MLRPLLASRPFAYWSDRLAAERIMHEQLSPDSLAPKYRRIVLKLSGDAFGEKTGKSGIIEFKCFGRSSRARTRQ